jgi:CRP-like cAMP-binding protein
MPRPQTRAGSISAATCRQIADSLKPKVAYLDLGKMLSANRLEIASSVGRDLPIRRYTDGQPIGLAENHEPPLLYIVSGAVDIFFPCGLGRSAVTRAGPGILFGQAPSLGLSMMGARAQAAGQTAALVVDLEAGDALLSALPEWRRLMGERLVRAEVELLRVSFSAIESLLIAVLLELADEDGVVQGITQKALAARLRVTRLMVLRVLTELKQAGLLEWKWKRMTLLDREGLASRLLF